MIGRYLLYVFAVSYGLQGAIAIAGGIESPAFPWLASLVMFVPGVVAVVEARRVGFKIPWRPLGWPYWFLAAVMPAVGALFCVAMIETLGAGVSDSIRFGTDGVEANHRVFLLGNGAQSWSFFALNLASGALVFSALAGLLAVGEEVGWRGFLQRQLITRFGAAKGLVLVGVIWAYWHLPLVLMGYNYPEYPVLGGLVLLPIVGIGLSFFLGGLTLRAKSVWPAVLGHGSVNALYGGLVYGIDFSEGSRLLGDGVVIVSTTLLGGLGWSLLGRSRARP